MVDKMNVALEKYDKMLDASEAAATTLAEEAEVFFDAASKENLDAEGINLASIISPDYTVVHNFAKLHAGRNTY